MQEDFYETRKEVYDRKGWELPTEPQNQWQQAHSERRVDLLKLYLELNTSGDE